MYNPFQEPTEAVKTSDPLGTRVTDGCELPCRRREPNPGPLQGQRVLFTVEPLL